MPACEMAAACTARSSAQISPLYETPCPYACRRTEAIDYTIPGLDVDDALADRASQPSRWRRACSSVKRASSRRFFATSANGSCTSRVSGGAGGAKARRHCLRHRSKKRTAGWRLHALSADLYSALGYNANADHGLCDSMGDVVIRAPALRNPMQLVVQPRAIHQHQLLLRQGVRAEIREVSPPCSEPLPARAECNTEPHAAAQV